MSTDDKIRAILRMEADEVQPSAAGWDAITTGIAARERRVWWLRGAALATATVVVAAVAFVATGDRSRNAIDQVPATSGPSVSESPSEPATESPAPVVPVESGAPIGAIWPLTTTGEVAAWEADHATYPSLATESGAALGFARTYLGIADASVSPAGTGSYDVTRPMGGSPHTVTTVDVRGFGNDGGAPYVVTLAHNDGITVELPAPGGSVVSPAWARGTYRSVEPSFTVTFRADSGASKPVDLVSGKATNSPPDVWEFRQPFATTAKTGSVLVTDGSAVDSGLGAAVAVPVRYGEGGGPPKTFVAARQQRLAVIDANTGAVVRWLTDLVPGGGDGAPELSQDGQTVLYTEGGGTCSAYVMSVPVTGGKPTVVVPAKADTVYGPASRRDAVLAYGRVRCQPGQSYTKDVTDVVLSGPGSASHVLPVDGVLRSGPVVGASAVMYVTEKATSTTLHVVGRDGSGERTAAPPAGCEWAAVTWNAPDASGHEGIEAAASCGGQAKLYDLQPDGSSTGVAPVGLGAIDVISLDRPTGYEGLVIGTFDPKTSQRRAYVPKNGQTLPMQPVPGEADAPTW